MRRAVVLHRGRHDLVVDGRPVHVTPGQPLAAARRLVVAWTVGRLRAVLPTLAADVVQRADADLTAVGHLHELGDRGLVDLMYRLRQQLTALHGHEVLAGMLLPTEEGRPSLPAVALETLRRGRAEGLGDGAVVARDPVVLALAPPTSARPARSPCPRWPAAAPRSAATAASANSAAAMHCGCAAAGPRNSGPAPRTSSAAAWRRRACSPTPLRCGTSISPSSGASWRNTSFPPTWPPGTTQGRRCRSRFDSRRPDAAAAVYETLRHAEVERPNPFRWLTDAAHGSTVPVLVPVLIGAGAVLSAIAYVVERIAEATAAPAFDRQVAQRLATMAPPAAGLLSGPVDPVPPAPANGALRPGAAFIRQTVLLAAVAILAWMGGNALVEGAQSRPDPADRPASTTIDLAVSYRSPRPPPPTVTADALWVACRSTLGSRPVTAEVQARGADGASLVLRPGVGRLVVRRLTGCLGDVRRDLARADVIRTVSVPA